MTNIHCPEKDIEEGDLRRRSEGGSHCGENDRDERERRMVWEYTCSALGMAEACEADEGNLLGMADSH